MLLVLGAEVSKGGEHRIGGSAAKTAKGSLFHPGSKLRKEFKIPGSSTTLGDVGEDFQHPSCTDPARRALATGLNLGELQEKPSPFHHAGGFIHHYHPPKPIIAPAAVRDS